MPRRPRLALIAGVLALSGLQGTAHPSSRARAYEWHSEAPGFGGLSAIEITADGTGLLALNDQGLAITATITRGDNGEILSLSDPELRPLLSPTGIRWPEGLNDTEGLAIAPDGRMFVAFEGPARVVEYPTANAAAIPLPDHSAFAAMQENAALEALAVAADGALYTFEEARPAAGNPVVYRFANGQWTTRFTLRSDGPFLPVAADIGPDGRLYLLERLLTLPGGFSSRLRRFDLTASGLMAEITLMHSAAGEFDNLEGLSVWRDTKGQLRATMVSDDNFLFVLRSQLVELPLPD